MDWIDEKVVEFQKKVKNLSLVRAAVVYFLCFAGIAWILAEITIRISSRKLQMFVTGAVVYSKMEGILWLLVQRWCAYLYLAVCMVIMLRLFYKHRLKKPLEILGRGAEEIQKQNLEFPMSYDCKDEMGRLCASFEKMRTTLVANHEEMWRLVENQKQLNAAFAHDLRTPLTVLKGYSEFLSRYLPEGKVSEKKVGEILELMTKQLERLTEFSKTMKEVRSLDEYPVEREAMELGHLYQTAAGILEALNIGGSVRLSMERNAQEKELVFADENIILEVLDNLLSNAIRYARTEIKITLELEQGEKQLYLYVEDDGKGFGEYELSRALRPYFAGEQEEEHFGIGLHICSMLCRNHGGAFSVANRIAGTGAIASASFFVGKPLS